MQTAHRRFKDAIYEEFSRVGKAVSAPKRLELLDLLSQAPRTVEALAEQANLSIANASRHLQVLRAARLVDTAKKGLYVEYRLADDQTGHFLAALRALAESRLAEVDQVTREYFEQRGEMETIQAEELLSRMRAGDVTLLDVRPAEEYRAGHIPGAISIPLGELERRLAELSKGQAIVAYCRGRYCVMALDAVELLRQQGFEAQRMEQGVVDWRGRGWRIDNEGAHP